MNTASILKRISHVATVKALATTDRIQFNVIMEHCLYSQVHYKFTVPLRSTSVDIFDENLNLKIVDVSAFKAALKIGALESVSITKSALIFHGAHGVTSSVPVEETPVKDAPNRCTYGIAARVTKDFVTAFNRSKVYAAKPKDRPNLAYVRLWGKEMQAADGFRLTIETLNAPEYTELNRHDIRIPAFLRIEEGDLIRFDGDQEYTHIRIEKSDFSFYEYSVAKSIFPNLWVSVPHPSTLENRVEVEKKQFLTVLNAVRSSDPLLVIFHKAKALIVSGEKTDYKLLATIALSTEVTNTTAVQYRFLYEYLRDMEGKTTSISWASGKTVVVQFEVSRQLALMMPMVIGEKITRHLD